MIDPNNKTISQRPRIQLEPVTTNDRNNFQGIESDAALAAEFFLEGKYEALLIAEPHTAQIHWIDNEEQNRCWAWNASNAKPINQLGLEVGQKIVVQANSDEGITFEWLEENMECIAC